MKNPKKAYFNPAFNAIYVSTKYDLVDQIHLSKETLLVDFIGVAVRKGTGYRDYVDRV